VAAAYLAIIGSAVSHLLLQRLLLAIGLAALVGFYLLARHGTGRARWLRVAGAVAVLAWPLGGWSDQAGFAALGVAFAVVTAAAVGDATRSRSQMRHERQAAMARVIAAERQQATMAERARIARELHDVVAHSVSVIAVQAELTPHTIPDLSPYAREGFQQIAHSARAAMAELRQLLDVLRRDGAVAADLSPQPTLDELEELVHQHRKTGGDIEFRILGARRPLAASVELSAYRIVQEALTNVRRHAPGAVVQLDIGYEADRLMVRVADDGPGFREDTKEETSAGHGLVGMRERAAMLGGRLLAGPVAEGGFVVAAELPLTAEGAARR
jgi:signal transduction histidine kinase